MAIETANSFHTVKTKHRYQMVFINMCVAGHRKGSNPPASSAALMVVVVVVPTAVIMVVTLVVKLIMIIIMVVVVVVAIVIVAAVIVAVAVAIVIVPPGARVRPPTNYWVSYQPTIGYLTNQLTTFLLSIFPPPLGNPCF